MTGARARPGAPGDGSGSQELSRDLGFFAVFTTATGTMIGAGIFVLPGIAAETAGPGAAISFLLAGLIAGIAALSVCELATAMPRAGGPYFFVSRAMGPLVGTMVGLGGWIALVLKGAFALEGFAQYLHYFSPVPLVASALVGGALLVAVNLVGARATGILQNVIVVGLLLILGLFVVRGLMAVDPEVLQPVLPHGWHGVFATTGVVFISYLGIAKAASLSEEVENPDRNIPLGILSSVVLVTVVYVATMVITTGVLPIAEVTGADAPLMEAGLLFLGASGGVIVAVGGILATLSTGNAAILSSARYPFAMARDGLITSWISHIHRRFRTPVRSILVTGVAMLLLVLVLDVEGLAKLGSVFGVLSFALINLSVILLRWTAPAWYRPSFRAPLYPVLPLLGAISALALVPQLGGVSQVTAGGFILVGAAWFHWHRRRATRQGTPIQPEYGFRDKLQELRAVHALEEKRKALEVEEAPVSPERPTVVAELVAGKPNKHLLALAAAIARRHNGVLDAVMVTEVPPQSPLEGAVPPPPAHWLKKIRARMRIYRVELRFHHVVARNRAHAVLGFVNPSVRAVLLDWEHEFRHHLLRGSYLDAILRKSPARVAILKYRGHKKYERILVATAGSPYAAAEVELADALAKLTGATVTFMMVLPSHPSPGREEQALEYLKRLDDLTESESELRIAKGESVTEEILAASRDHDLIILGTTRQLTLSQIFGGHIVGGIADEIAERAEVSVLVTRDPAASRRVSFRLERWLGRLRRQTLGTPASNESPRPAIEPFPRPDRRRGR
jgi:amino acid transporter/nucleotide-binding universal stress UspA family protein